MTRQTHRALDQRLMEATKKVSAAQYTFNHYCDLTVKADKALRAAKAELEAVRAQVAERDAVYAEVDEGRFR